MQLLIHYKIKQIEVFLSKLDRKSTRLNSSHVKISYAVFFLNNQPHNHRDQKSIPTRRSSDLTKESDKEKLFINLQVELVEEGLRIVNLKDENGKEFEEIVFE